MNTYAYKYMSELDLFVLELSIWPYYQLFGSIFISHFGCQRGDEMTMILAATIQWENKLIIFQPFEDLLNVQIIFTSLLT